MMVESAPSLAGLTVRKGSRTAILTLRTRLVAQREIIDSQIADLDRAASRAFDAARQARLDVARIEGQLEALDAALATTEAS